jgi:cysteine desulfurase/selenocysteine lyase
MNDISNYFPGYCTLSKKNETYLDSASTSLKPNLVIESVNDYWTNHTSNVARSQYESAELTTSIFEKTRKDISEFINCYANEVIFTFGSTHGINSVNFLLSNKKQLHVLTTELEHHSNLLPWLKNHKVTFLKLDHFGRVDLECFSKLNLDQYDLLAIQHVSNVTGNINDIKSICHYARAAKLLTLIDGAQAIGHLQINVKELDCDFYVFSGHKVFAPTGVGVLYIRNSIEKSLNPCYWGGGMVNYIGHDQISCQESPGKFEAGTPSIEGVIGLGASIKFIEQIGGIQKIHKYLHQLDIYFQKKLLQFDFLKPLVPFSENHMNIYTFNLKSNRISSKVFSQILIDSYGMNINSGYQCCQLFYRSRNLEEGIRFSMHIYNNMSDVDRLVRALESISALV